MNKKEVAAVLEEIALLLELAGENPFKVRAFEAGARAVLTFPGDLDAARRSGELARVKGIGKSLAGVIDRTAHPGGGGAPPGAPEPDPAGASGTAPGAGIGPQKGPGAV